MSLARKQNVELLAIFEASFNEEKSNSISNSFDGDSHIENFDEKFFLDNARDIVAEESERKT